MIQREIFKKIDFEKKEKIRKTRKNAERYIEKKPEDFNRKRESRERFLRKKKYGKPEKGREED